MEFSPSAHGALLRRDVSRFAESPFSFHRALFDGDILAGFHRFIPSRLRQLPFSASAIGTGSRQLDRHLPRSRRRFSRRVHFFLIIKRCVIGNLWHLPHTPTGLAPVTLRACIRRQLPSPGDAL